MEKERGTAALWRDGRVFDMPPQPVERYIVRETPARCSIWHFNHKIREAPAGRVLRLELLAPAVVQWSVDGWRSIQDSATADMALGVHVRDLPVQNVRPDVRIDFTFFWPEVSRWEQVDFGVTIVTSR